MHAMNKKHITFAGISDLLHTEGVMHLSINRLNGYFVPFVFFTTPGALTPVGHGPIAVEGNLVASLELEALCAELRDVVGDVKIYAPDVVEKPAATLH
ncbi:hypothetical protein [Janthinobacterium sp. MDT1-19]|uniref:hypothetical protein n=1 Tax=Janthinobacterium sp. MDT1-19 TaxID=1259339 RepID=UPI003F20E75B